MNCTRPNYVRILNDERVGYEGKKKVIFMPYVGANYSYDFHHTMLENDPGLIQIPCGQCAACRLDYSRVWANRCYLESLEHEYCWFITLTYDDAHLIYGDKGFATLEKEALSHFMKNLRNKFRKVKNIRYFGCGEYGDNTMRPHYHIIVFGAPLFDLTIDMPDMSKERLASGMYPIFRRKNSNGDYVYFSQTIYDCWQKGKVEVEEAGWNCAAYVSRYVMKKQKGKGKEIYNRLGLLPEFLRMSNRPGIGAKWLLENKEKLLTFDYLSVKNRKGVETIRPPRYFEKLMKKDEDSVDAYLMDSNKYNRMINAKKRFIERQSQKSVGQTLLDREETLVKKTKVFTRDIT